mmetsp:Transcript_25261/g.22385  ORF Transcript_25261/g.22385 Transcript_25261/m.22385 type:complete len:160 (-) Transcript_25261:40-519(-)
MTGEEKDTEEYKPKKGHFQHLRRDSRQIYLERLKENIIKIDKTKNPKKIKKLKLPLTPFYTTKKSVSKLRRDIFIRNNCVSIRKKTTSTLFTSLKAPQYLVKKTTDLSNFSHIEQDINLDGKLQVPPPCVYRHLTVRKNYLGNIDRSLPRRRHNLSSFG